MADAQVRDGLGPDTESARSVLVDIASGETPAKAVRSYAVGAMDEILPVSTLPVRPAWAFPKPVDWLATLGATISDVLAVSGVEAD